MELQKELNRRSYSEHLIKDIDLVNKILLDNKIYGVKVISETKTLLIIDSFSFSTTFNFPLYKEVESLEVIDIKKINQGAAGIYSKVLKPLNCGLETKRDEFDFERALMYSNPAYTNTELIDNVYYYDKNSAYLSVLATGWFPDLTQQSEDRFVKDGEIGYRRISIGERPILQIKLPGEYAEYIYPLKYYPKVVKWAQKQGELLKYLKGVNPQERAAKKQMINAAIGIIRNHNIWIYTFIVGICRRDVEQYISDKTIIANTDGIISIGPIDDIDIGDNLGQFKLEHENIKLRARNNNYILYDQDEAVIDQKLRGVPKAQREGYTFDQGVIVKPDYYFDKASLQVMEV